MDPERPPRPLATVPDELWREYWRRTPALRRAWRDEVASLRMYDARGVNKRTFMRGWAAAARAYRAQIEKNAVAVKEAVEGATAKALAAWERTTNISLLD